MTQTEYEIFKVCDEYFRRVDSGESIDPELFAGQYPEISKEILDYIMVGDIVDSVIDWDDVDAPKLNQLLNPKKRSRRTLISCVGGGVALVLFLVIWMWPPSLVEVAMRYEDSGEWALAAHAYEEVYEIEGNPDYLAAAGYCHLMLDDLKLANALLEDAVRNGSSADSTLNNLGCTYYRMKLLDKASECFSEVDSENMAWVQWTLDVRSGVLRDRPTKSLQYRKPDRTPETTHQMQ